MRYFK